MDLDRFFTRINPLITAILRLPLLHWTLSPTLALLTVTGRRSGRRYTIPVAYQRCDGGIFVLVSKARRKNWWRNYLETGPVDVFMKRRHRQGTARVLAASSEKFRTYAERSFRRVPGLGLQFGLTFDRRTGLTDEQITHLGREAAIVEITLRCMQPRD